MPKLSWPGLGGRLTLKQSGAFEDNAQILVFTIRECDEERNLLSLGALCACNVQSVYRALRRSHSGPSEDVYCMLAASSGGIEAIDNAALVQPYITLHRTPLPSTYDGGQDVFRRLIGGAFASLSGPSKHFLSQTAQSRSAQGRDCSKTSEGP